MLFSLYILAQITQPFSQSGAKHSFSATTICIASTNCPLPFASESFVANRVKVYEVET